ncbi:TPA: glycosyltransferase [Vibrio vulnificus]
MNKVLISCVLAVNKLDKFLPVAIDSILKQTYKNFELIIIANNCADELWSYLLELKDTDSRIIIRRTSIGQLVFNLNYGIDIAKGKYIARMDADDISLPDRFEKQLSYLESNDQVNMLATNFSKIDEFGNYIAHDVVKAFTNTQIRRALKKYNPLAHPSLMFRKSDILQNRGYAWSMWAEDYEYHLRCSRDNNYTFHCLEDVLLLYRISSSQMTANNNSLVSYADESALLFREFIMTNNFKYLLRILRINRRARRISRLLRSVFGR